MSLFGVLSGLALAGSFAQTGPMWHGGAIKFNAIGVMFRNSEKMYNQHSFEAVCKTEVTATKDGKVLHHHEVSRLIAVKPNLMRYDAWHKLRAQSDWTAANLPPTRADLTFACDGKTNYQQFGPVYRTASLKDLSTILEPWSGFYSGLSSAYGVLMDGMSKGYVLSGKLLGRKPIQGILCDVVFFKTKTSYNGETMNEDDTYFVGVKDLLIHREISSVSFGSRAPMVRDCMIQDIRLNKSFSPTLFRYKPPKGVTLEAEAAEQPVLPNGQLAPNFTAVTADGAKHQLAEFKGKVVVVDFWASWCGPCNESMPHTQQVIQSLQSSGVPVVALAVDDGEAQDGFQGWVKANQTKYPNLSFVFSDPKKQVSGSLYKVSGIPTQFVIDKGGVVRASFVGYGGPSNDLEQAIRSAAK